MNKKKATKRCQVTKPKIRVKPANASDIVYICSGLKMTLLYRIMIRKKSFENVTIRDHVSERNLQSLQRNAFRCGDLDWSVLVKHESRTYIQE